MAQSITIPADARAALEAQYDVLRELGRGAMGTVYLAQERLLQRRVAVKVLPSAASTDTEARARFLREARTAARLTHPCIVPLYSFMEAGSSLLYIMGYIEGESLADLLAREGRLQPVAARRIVDSIADALGYAHSQGVIHRDVKPDNILIESSTGRAFLADFGVARESAGGDTLTHAGTVVGTPHYMSPEQAGGGTVDTRSDLYSLGIVAFQMLSGQLPFGGTTLRDVLAQRITRDPAELGTVMPGTPEDLAIAVSKSLRREPADRWKDAAALRASLQLDAERPPVLPEPLEDLPSMGSKMLGMHAALGLAASVLYAWQKDSAWLALAITIPAISFPLLIARYVIAGRKEGYNWRRIISLFFWAPERWVGWWPKSLRRPGNVWDRLPASVRRFRTAMLAAAAFGIAAPLPVFALYLLLNVAGELERAEALVPSFPVALAALGLATAATYTALGWTYVWKKKYGLTAGQANKLLLEPVVSAFWKKSELAHVLLEAAPVIPLAPRSPTELAEAIAVAMAKLSPVLRDHMGEADRMAREAAAYAALIRREIAELAQELNPEERHKLELRLEELEGGGRAHLRDLVHAQLRVMDELEQRRAALADTHERIERGLMQIWLQLSGLRGGELGAELQDAEITVRIRALCDDLGMHERAAAEVAQLVTPQR